MREGERGGQRERREREGERGKAKGEIKRRERDRKRREKERAKEGEIKRGEMRDNNDCQHDDKNRVGALDRQNIKVNVFDQLFNHEGNKWQTVALMEPLDWSTYVHYLVILFT